MPPIPDTQKKLDPRLASTLGQDLKRNAKLQEIGILAHRYYIPEKAREVAKLAAAAYAIRDDGHLDLMLNNLRRGFSPY
jgi:vacuolar-type H+-ATPase subunit C/Vma6